MSPSAHAIHESGNGAHPALLLNISGEMAQGQYGEALASVQAALRRFPTSVSLRLLALDASRYNGRPQDVARQMETLERVVMGSPQLYATPEGRLALGRFFLSK